MKNFLLLTAISATLFFNAAAQTIPAPEFNNKVMFLNSGNSLAELDKTEIETTYGASPFTGTAKTHIKAKGANAAVKHSGAPSELYVVRIAPGVDPETIIELLKFDVSKKSRTIEMGKMVLGKSKSNVEAIKLGFKKIEEGVYAISPMAQLEEGEYVFLVERPDIDVVGSAMSKKKFYGYCFGVTK